MIPVSQQNRTVFAYMLATPPEALAAASVEPPFRGRLYKALLDRGDMFMAMVRAYTPASGELSEQFDQTTGAQSSAKNLAWSYAAFVAAVAGNVVEASAVLPRLLQRPALEPPRAPFV